VHGSLHHPTPRALRRLAEAIGEIGLITYTINTA
jgi:hypothetical protein